MATDSRELRFYSATVDAPDDHNNFLFDMISRTLNPSQFTSKKNKAVGNYLVTHTRTVSTTTTTSHASSTSSEDTHFEPQQRPTGDGSSSVCIDLTPEESNLFDLLRSVTEETEIQSTLRVAGGWVRDKLLATPEFSRTRRNGIHSNNDNSNHVQRLTSKFKGTPGQQPSMGRKGTKILSGSTKNGGERVNGLSDFVNQPVDIDIALDDMLGREFADHLNEFLSDQGRETISVGVVLKNPEKSKHLETATMKVGSFWIDFVNLRAEEYTNNSRIPDLMRIGTAEEDAYRRDLTINSLFYNINTGRVEDLTGRGFEDLKLGVVSTPLPPLTTLLDDPLRVLRSIRFAARLRFTMDAALREAALDTRVREALEQKVSRERVGGEVDLMFRSPDPVGAMRLLINLNLIGAVFPICRLVPEKSQRMEIFNRGLVLLSTTHDYLCDCKLDPPVWSEYAHSSLPAAYGVVEQTLTENDEARRLLWYASFLKPVRDHSKSFGKLNGGESGRSKGKKGRQSVIYSTLVDELKRPTRDADAVEKIMKAADDFTQLIECGCDFSATAVLLSEVRVQYNALNGDGEETVPEQSIVCSMNGEIIDSDTEEDPVWQHAMEFRLLCSKTLGQIGPLWRAALILSLSEKLSSLGDDLDYAIEGDVFAESREEFRLGYIERYDAFAASMMQLGLIGSWAQKPTICGSEMKTILTNIPKGAFFREVMDAQVDWMMTHPCGSKEALIQHLKDTFTSYV